jgi:hypothetical protein
MLSEAYAYFFEEYCASPNIVMKKYPNLYNLFVSDIDSVFHSKKAISLISRLNEANYIFKNINSDKR